MIFKKIKAKNKKRFEFFRQNFRHSIKKFETIQDKQHKSISMCDFLLETLQ